MKSLGFLIAPGKCLLCELPSQRPRDLCRYCERSLSWIKSPCVCCATAQATTQNISGTGFTNWFASTAQPPQFNCARCQRSSTVSVRMIQKMVAPLAYTGCVSVLIKQIKRKKGDVAARVLAELLGDALLLHYASHLIPEQNWPDAMVAVPLHWRRSLVRGHNQSDLLARHVAHRFRLPVLNNVVRRKLATKSQQALNRQHRAENLAGAVVAAPNAAKVLNGLNIAIVDDVVTTGATVSALADVLRSVGVQDIHVWSPARAILVASAVDEKQIQRE